MGEDAEEMGEDVVGEEEQLGKTGEDKWASTLVRVTGFLSVLWFTQKILAEQTEYVRDYCISFSSPHCRIDEDGWLKQFFFPYFSRK